MTHEISQLVDWKGETLAVIPTMYGCYYLGRTFIADGCRSTQLSTANISCCRTLIIVASSIRSRKRGGVLGVHEGLHGQVHLHLS